MPLTPRRALAAVAASLAGLALVAGAAAAPSSTIPFGSASPFNLLVPHSAPVASNGGSLSGSSLGLAGRDYTPAVYVSSPSDPSFTVRLTAGWGPNPLNGRKVRVDPRIRPGGGSDGHVTIVVPHENIVISLYQAQPPSGGTLSAAWGGIAPLDGSGANRSDSIGGRESGISQLAGLITPDDVRRGIAAGAHGDLGHALAFLHPTISNRTFVPPAIRAGGNSSDGLMMGQRVFLDPAVDVDGIPFEGDAKAQRFGRLVARTLQRYGAIVVSNAAGTGFQLVNPASWTSIGQANPWPELIGADRSGYYNFTVRAIPASRLRAMAPSASGIPPASAPPPAAPGPAGESPTARPRPWIRVTKRFARRSSAQVSIAVTVRSSRAATVKVGARPIAARTRTVSRRVARVAARNAVTLVVRVPVAMRGPARVRLVVSATDRAGRTVVLQRRTLRFRRV